MSLYSYIFIIINICGGVFNSKYCQSIPNGSEHNNNITEIIENFKVLWSVDDWSEEGYFTKEYICDINIHWLSFGPPTKSSFISLAIIYIIIMLIGVLGNFLVVFLFIRCKALRTPGNKLIVNLAVSDGMMLIKTPIFIYNCFRMGPALGDIGCRIYGFLGGLTGAMSIVTLSAISFDRYFMIKFPLNRAYSNLRVKICLIVIWLYSLMFSLVPALDIGLGKYTYEGYLTSCSFDYLTKDTNKKYFIFCFFVAAWVVPLALIAFSYTNIVRIVTARSSTNKKGRDSFRHVKEEDRKKQEIKLAFVVFCSICLWFVAWTPYAIVALLGIFDQNHLLSPLASMVPALFCKAASCINPFLYALSHPKFRSELKNICSRGTESNKGRKVWSTHDPKGANKFGSYEEAEVEEEIVQLDSKPSRQASIESNVNIPVQKNKLKRTPSVVEMICLRPNFSNKSTAFRKLSRRWSMNKRENKVNEED